MMTTENYQFPISLEYTIKRKINNNIDIAFYDSVYIRNEVFNLSFVEPFKIIFTNKRKSRHIICFMIQQQINGKNKYEFFIGNIQKENKRSMTSILDFVNQSL